MTFCTGCGRRPCVRIWIYRGNINSWCFACASLLWEMGLDTPKITCMEQHIYVLNGRLENKSVTWSPDVKPTLGALLGNAYCYETL